MYSEEIERVFTRAMDSFDSGDYESSIKFYSRVIELDSSIYQAYNNRGNAYSQVAKYTEALEDYDMAIDLNPLFFQAYNNRGNAKFQMGLLKEALLDFELAIKLNPEYAEPYHNKANLICITEGFSEEAVRNYKASIERNPDFYKSFHEISLIKSLDECIKRTRQFRRTGEKWTKSGGSKNMRMLEME